MRTHRPEYDLAEPVATLPGVLAVTVLERTVSTSTRKRPRTIRMYLAAVRAFLDYASRDPARWSGAVVEAWRDELVRSGLAGTTINSRLSGLKFASKRAYLLGLLDEDFARAAELVQVIFERKRKAPSLATGKQLAAACCGESPVAFRDRAMIVVALRTGCRREGLAELKLEDVETNASAITVALKGGRRHRIVLDSETSAALGAWLRWLAAKRIADGHAFRSLRQGIRGWIVGKRLHVSSINFIFSKRAEHAGIGKFFPHLARHGFVSWADAAGIPRRRIAAVTGHRDLSGLAPYLHDLEEENDPVSAHLPPLFDV